ncbi:MAG: translation initiation factor IF-2 N-terminal domain-containing protein [Chitinivibrionales bacterium]
MAKEKVYNLAKEFNVSSEALVQILKSMGIPVKGHMSTVDESLREKIKEKFELERTEIKNRYARKRKRISKAKNARTAAKAAKTEKPQKEPVKEKTGETKTGETHQKKETAPAEKRRVHRPYKSSSRGSGNIQEWHDEAGELPGAKTKQDKAAKETQAEGKKSKKPE